MEQQKLSQTRNQKTELVGDLHTERIYKIIHKMGGGAGEKEIWQFRYILVNFIVSKFKNAINTQAEKDKKINKFTFKIYQIGISIDFSLVTVSTKGQWSNIQRVRGLSDMWHLRNYDTKIPLLQKISQWCTHYEISKNYIMRKWIIEHDWGKLWITLKI